MSDPFMVPPRSVISFSGGRTSGFLLRRVLTPSAALCRPTEFTPYLNCSYGKT